ncbi:putative F-box/FBD/LRR-repeat protein [Prunus yedoensis var. nudiflora]|uniref:Putative F-box/FBD/LRR-repeat protein n=1 Tax=Prunus yedoensis var. nudiflora TaxID=2094558 RepID=A0A314ZMK8_PRUYE|nr:putative F-box/FBD/LRR-repeat protein [Prunus yedoensis var. nudiflora]
MFFKWIASSCKCIKKLELLRIGGIQNITIESSSLENFRPRTHYKDPLHFNISGEKLETIDIELRPTYCREPNSNSLKVFAPNLKHLKWKGSVGNVQNLGKLMSLEKVELLLRHEGNQFGTVIEVLCNISWPKVLIISEETIKAMFQEGSMGAPILDNICDLSVHCISLNDDFVPAAGSFLRGMPNLNILCIRRAGTWIDAETSELKEVTVEYSDNGSNEIEFASYILELAQNLKKMVIVLNCETMRSKVVAEIVSRSKMISTAAVI